MNNPTCDNECTEAGWLEWLADFGPFDMHISTAPDADLDDVFMAFCHDTQEIVRVRGWLCTLNPV